MDWSKLSSGKFIFTIIAGIVYAYMSIKGMLPADKVYDIILVVVYAYFTRKGQDNGNNIKP